MVEMVRDGKVVVLVVVLLIKLNQALEQRHRIIHATHKERDGREEQVVKEENGVNQV